MRPFTTLFLVLLAVPTVLGDDAKDKAVKEELKTFAGKWKQVGGESGGKATDFSQNPGPLVIAGDKLVVEALRQKFEFTIRLDPTQNPKQLDLVSDAGVTNCIYKLDGDTLTICSNDTSSDGKKEPDRPKEFKTAEGNSFRLSVLKRVKE